MRTPSLFDEPETEPEQSRTEQAEATDETELDDWHEVPAARFLSWSAVAQFGYCRKRDLDSALRADNNDDAQFFLDRAKMYERLMNDETSNESTQVS